MKTRNITLTLCSVVVAAAISGLASPAFAQDATPPATTTAPPHVARTSGDVGNGGFGLGAEAFVSGLAGPEVVYDAGGWHLEGLLGFDRRPAGGPNPPSTTTFDFGVSGWYHLHVGASSDFSLGGGFALLTSSTGNAGTATGFEFEPGAEIRAFVTPNVAVSAKLGIVLAFGDRVGVFQQQIGLDGQLVAGFGLTYFFR
jgi:hypothetical protein